MSYERKVYTFLKVWSGLLWPVDVSKNYWLSGKIQMPSSMVFSFIHQNTLTTLTSACIKGNLGVKDSQKLPWDFQKPMPGSLGLPTFKDI